MDNRFLIPISLVTGFAVVVTASAMSNQETECQRNAVVTMEERKLDAFRNYNQDVENAREDRLNSLSDAWGNTNDRERKDDIRQAEREYKDRVREASRTMKDAEREAKRDYNDERKNCREQQKDQCSKVQCPNGKRVNICDDEGNPLPEEEVCDGQEFSSRSSRSRSSRDDDDGDRCRSSNDCRNDEYCTTEDGQCLSPCEEGENCIQVCEGVCRERDDGRSSSRSSRSSSVRSSSSRSMSFRSSSSRSTSSRSSSIRSSSSRSADRCPTMYCPYGCRDSQCLPPENGYCGDGVCEGSENALACPQCAPGTPASQCRCRRACEADCG